MCVCVVVVVVVAGEGGSKTDRLEGSVCVEITSNSRSQVKEHWAFRGACLQQQRQAWHVFSCVSLWFLPLI